MLKALIGLLFFLTCFAGYSADSSVKGIVDLRIHQVDSDAESESYLNRDYGKFRFDNGSGISLGQLGLKHQLTFENNWSTTLVANGFSEQGNFAFGVTEAYLGYKGLPSENGWRISSKLGVFYPAISVENIATAWSSPYTITSSSLNNWIGEELRNTGVELSIERLGKFSDSDHNFQVDIALFQNNDTTGAMLTWHGWTLGSRQTLLQEKLSVQNFPARAGMLSVQAANSDPFIELDNRWGAHVSAEWRYKNKVEFNAGYYDNHAQKGLVEQGQYTWTTAFYHAEFKAKLSHNVEISSQLMVGDTYMNSPTGLRVVGSDFDNAFVMIRHFKGSHHIAARVEAFSVSDLDATPGDNNHESGKAFTTAYRYKVNRKSFLLAEFNWVNSHRPSRYYYYQPTSLIERQYQLAYRYYF